MLPGYHLEDLRVPLVVHVPQIGNTCRRWFEQLSSSIGWRVMVLQSLVKKVASVRPTGLYVFTIRVYYHVCLRVAVISIICILHGSSW